MKRLLVFAAAFLAACAGQPQTRPQPADSLVLPPPDSLVDPQNVKLYVYDFADLVFRNLGRITRDTDLETAACITRWNSVWQGDTLKALQVYTAVIVRPIEVSDTSFVPSPSVGNCWWQLPSIHWHVYGIEPSPKDYIYAVQSNAPFHIVVYNGEFRLYAVRPQTLKRNNPR